MRILLFSRHNISSKGGLALALLILVSACSTTSYEQPVKELAAATQNAKAAVAALDQSMTAKYRAALNQDILDRKKLLNAKSGECNLTSLRCRLVAVDADGIEELFPPEPVLGNFVQLMSSVDEYAQGLAAIANADTAKGVEAHVNSTLGSIENLARIAGDHPISRNLSAYKTPVGKGINWIFGQYVAKVKVNALREATSRADPVIDQATGMFEDASGFAADISKLGSTNKFDAARVKFEEDISAANLKAYVAEAGTYDRILIVQPSEVYGQLRLAHRSLTNSLNNGDATFLEAVANIKSFAAQAKTLAEIVREIAGVDDN